MQIGKLIKCTLFYLMKRLSVHSKATCIKDWILVWEYKCFGLDKIERDIRYLHLDINQKNDGTELLLFTIILKDSHEMLDMYQHAPGGGYHWCISDVQQVKSFKCSPQWPSGLDVGGC